MKKILPLLLISLLAGCSLFPKADKQLAKGVYKYCEVTDQEERKAIRNRTNKMLEEQAKDPKNPAVVCGVKCPGDKEVPKCPDAN